MVIGSSRLKKRRERCVNFGRHREEKVDSVSVYCGGDLGRLNLVIYLG
jgi:hypothetical protein